MIIHAQVFVAAINKLELQTFVAAKTSHNFSTAAVGIFKLFRGKLQKL